MKKLLALLLALATLLTLVACGGTTSESSKVEESKSSESSKTEESSEENEAPAEVGRFDALQTTDEQVSLLVEWSAFQPTVNEEPTEESPTVYNAARYIANDWLADKPNVTLEWARNIEMTEEWVTVNFTAGTGPDTLHYWGGKIWVERDMALILDDIISSPNYYQEGSPIWKDMFPEYLFDGTEGTKMAVNDKLQVVAIPQSVAPGSATAYYVNKDLMAELGIEHNPYSWKEMKEAILLAREAGYTGTVTYNNNDEYQVGSSWDSQFTLAAPYYAPMIPDLDYNGDGIADTAEAFRKQWQDGYFYLQNNPGMEEYWEEYMWKIHYGLEEGCFDIDYSQAWSDGKVLFWEDGMWSLRNFMSDPEIDFEVGAFPPPTQSSADSQYVVDIEMTESGPYKPNLNTAINIMNPESQNRPDYVVDYIVDLFKFLMTDENMSLQVEESGTVLGPTKGCKVPSYLADWVTNSFPQMPVGYNAITPGSTDATVTEKRALIEQYMYNMIDHDTWVKQYDELLYKTVMDYFNYDFNVENKEYWAEYYGEGWDVSIWDAEPVKPPHMA